MKLTFTLTFTLLLCGVSAQSEETLQSSSPFLPPGYGEKEEEAAPPPVAAPTQGPLSREIEFRGVVQIGKTYQFSLFSKKENKGYWIEEDTSESGIRVRDFNPSNSTLVISKNGRSERLTMVSATDSPLPVAVSTTSNDAPKAKPKNSRPNANASSNKRRRVVPRRRVILPKSD
jgi:hypothetical protein